MILWLVILLSLAAAYFGLKRGFFFMFATLFHIMFAVFISILTAPIVLAMSPGFETNGYYAGATVILLFILIFFVLEGFGWFFFLKDREDFFPKMLEKAGGAVLGFICGYAFSCTFLIALCIMPVSRGKIDWLCTRESLRGISAPGVLNVCNFIGWYSLECFNGDVENAVEQLLALNDITEEDAAGTDKPKDLNAQRETETNENTPAEPVQAPAPDAAMVAETEGTQQSEL